MAHTRILCGVRLQVGDDLRRANEQQSAPCFQLDPNGLSLDPWAMSPGDIASPRLSETRLARPLSKVAIHVARGSKPPLPEIDWFAASTSMNSTPSGEVRHSTEAPRGSTSGWPLTSKPKRSIVSRHWRVLVWPSVLNDHATTGGALRFQGCPEPGAAGWSLGWALSRSNRWTDAILNRAPIV